MSNAALRISEPVLPAAEDVAQAKEAARALARLLPKHLKHRSQSKTTRVECTWCCHARPGTV